MIQCSRVWTAEHRLLLPELLLAVVAPLSNRMQRPHIVLVLADDLGWNGVGYRNPDLKTPAIDALAATGLRLESFYTHRLCGPSRASLLTGRMPYKLEATRTNFVEFWEESGTELEYTMLPEHLRRQGYSTHLVGKWHQVTPLSILTPSTSSSSLSSNTSFYSAGLLPPELPADPARL